MSAVRRCSSASSFGRWRCVERCWTRTRQVRRSDTGRTRRTCSIVSRRREGFKKSPSMPPGGSLCPARGPQLASSAAHSPAPDRWPCGRLRPHPTYLINLQAAIFLTPSIQRLLRDPDLPTGLNCRRSTLDKRIYFTQLRNDLLRGKSLTPIYFHSFRPRGLSLEMDQFSQGRPAPRIFKKRSPSLPGVAQEIYAFSPTASSSDCEALSTPSSSFELKRTRPSTGTAIQQQWLRGPASLVWEFAVSIVLQKFVGSQGIQAPFWVARCEFYRF